MRSGDLLLALNQPHFQCLLGSRLLFKLEDSVPVWHDLLTSGNEDKPSAADGLDSIPSRDFSRRHRSTEVQDIRVSAAICYLGELSNASSHHWRPQPRAAPALSPCLFPLGIATLAIMWLLDCTGG